MHLSSEEGSSPASQLLTNALTAHLQPAWCFPSGKNQAGHNFRMNMDNKESAAFRPRR